MVKPPTKLAWRKAAVDKIAPPASWIEPCRATLVRRQSTHRPRLYADDPGVAQISFLTDDSQGENLKLSFIADWASTAAQRI
jgi:hypothetical protein